MTHWFTGVNDADLQLPQKLVDAVEASAEPEEELANQIFEFTHNPDAWSPASDSAPPPGAAAAEDPPPELGDDAVVRIRDDGAHHVLEFVGTLMRIRLKIYTTWLRTHSGVVVGAGVVGICVGVDMLTYWCIYIRVF